MILALAAWDFAATTVNLDYSGARPRISFRTPGLIYARTLAALDKLLSRSKLTW